jgi:hypothetical protein
MALGSIDFYMIILAFGLVNILLMFGLMGGIDYIIKIFKLNDEE